MVGHKHIANQEKEPLFDGPQIARLLHKVSAIDLQQLGEEVILMEA